MRRLLLHTLIAAICFNTATTVTVAQGMAPQKPSLFYEEKELQLDKQAVEMLKKHLQHLEETHASDRDTLPLLSALALLLRNTPDRQQSIEYFKKVMAIRESLGDHLSEEYKNELTGYAEAAYQAGDYQKAEELLAKLIPLASEYDVKHKLKFDLIECYTKENNISQAEHLLKETLKQNESVGQCFSAELLGAGEWYALQHRFDEAKPWYLKAISKAKAEGSSSEMKKAERALAKFFVKEQVATDLNSLWKKSPPQISVTDGGAKLEIGGVGGVSCGCGWNDKDANNPDQWVKEYREACKQLRAKHYLQAEFQFKSGAQKYTGSTENTAFNIGLAKTYQEMKNDGKLREVVAVLVKTQDKAALPSLRPLKEAAAPKTAAVKAKK
jgi:tetratricopeptide (TPR) repeat protein